MMPYRKNGKGRANALRKLKRFKVRKGPLVLTTLESHTHREACLPWEYFCWLFRLARPAKPEKRFWACSTVYHLEYSFPDDHLRMSHPECTAGLFPGLRKPLSNCRRHGPVALGKHFRQWGQVHNGLRLRPPFVCVIALRKYGRYSC